MAKAPEKRSTLLLATSAIGWILLVGGLVGWFASTVLTIEKFDVLKNPASSAVCDLNPIFSCSSVASSSQAEVFGFPNPIIGIAGYTVLATIGALILAGGQFRRWLWIALEIGLLAATIFIHWLIYQTLYHIGALCLFCMIAWTATIPMFWYVTIYNLRQGHIKTPEVLQRSVSFASKHHGDLLLLWFLLIIFLIGKRFWYYWSTLF